MTQLLIDSFKKIIMESQLHTVTSSIENKEENGHTDNYFAACCTYGKEIKSSLKGKRNSREWRNT